MEGNQNPQMESLGGCKPGSAWEIIWLYILHEGNRPLTIHFYSVWKRLKSSHWNLLTLSSGINVTKLLSQRVCFDVWWSLSRICIYIYMYVIYDMFVYMFVYIYIYIYVYLSSYLHRVWHTSTASSNNLYQLYNILRYDHPPPHRPPPGSFGEAISKRLFSELVEQIHYTLKTKHWKITVLR